MDSLAFGRWGVFGVLVSLGCSSVSSPPERRRSPASSQDGGAATDVGKGNTSEAASETSLGPQSNTDSTTGEEEVNRCKPSPAPAPAPETSSGAQPNPDGTTEADSSSETDLDVDAGAAVEGEHWALVRLEDSNLPYVEEWTYDAAARLVKARIVNIRRDLEPYYAVDITNTYDANRVVSVHDRLPEDLVDLTYEYELEAGRVVTYVESAEGETYESRAYVYDSEGRLMGSRETHSGEEEEWRFERRENGEPSQLFRNDELACAYEWRHMWLGTTCYNAGVVSQVYYPDAAGRLGSLSFDGSEPVNYSYDDAGRLTAVLHTNAAYEYRYAPDGKLLASTGPDYEELREYDEFGQLREVQWSDESSVSTTTFTYERRSADEVVQTEVSSQRTVVRTYARLPQAPTSEPALPSYWTLLRMDQPSVYIAPLDFSNVP